MYNKIMIAPNTDLILLKCPIELDNDNQLNFSNSTAQFNYFNGLPKLIEDNFTYQRKDGKIRYPACADDLYSYNYCMYRNSSYSNKWFYAFITDIEYLNDNTSLLTIKTDVWQTWQFDLNFRKCFVEREHVNDDTVGKHTVPESLEYGEYIVNSAANIGSSYTFSNCYLIVQVSQLCKKMYQSWNNAVRVYGGLPNGCWFIALYGNNNSTIYSNLQGLIRSYDAENLSDAIVNIFVAPKVLVDVGAIALSFDTEYPFDAYQVLSTASYNTLNTYSIARNTSINGYVPKNNKLYVSPYNYLMITNNGGSDVCYAWEDFSSSNANFTERGVLSSGCDIKLTPSNYKNTDLNGGYNHSINRQKFPTVSWNSNFYLNWKAVNENYMEVQATLTGLDFATGVIGGMLSGNAGSMVNAVGGLADKVANMAQQVKVAQMTPNESKGNLNTGDLNYTVGKNCFTYYKMSIKAEYAKIIDDYFSAFGYRVNSLKVPNITGRTNWNYVKTQGCNVIGDVPQTDIEEIKSMFNRGITIWHNASTFLDYSQSNNIV